MKSARMIVLGAALGIISQAALAFQETNSGSATGATGAGPTADINLPAPVSKNGPEIKVPGLGTIGALPKLDFGLELLYGASGQQAGPRDDKQDTGAQIRGTLKYRFPN